MLPSQYIKLDRCEKAFIIAAIQIKTENDKNKAKNAKKKPPK